MESWEGSIHAVAGAGLHCPWHTAADMYADSMHVRATVVINHLAYDNPASHCLHENSIFV